MTCSTQELIEQLWEITKTRADSGYVIPKELLEDTITALDRLSVFEDIKITAMPEKERLLLEQRPINYSVPGQYWIYSGLRWNNGIAGQCILDGSLNGGMAGNWKD